MQSQSLKVATRQPTMLVHRLSDQEIAVRFWNIGGRSQFMALLGRFRSEFLLARPAKIDGLDWLIVTQGQYGEVTDFCRRYGMQIHHEV
ncbi:MAG: hypothetical protein HGA65_00525 [Oscillochloris sp.]|nr:hypothetical protein [Oscillochloris sp.]